MQRKFLNCHLEPQQCDTWSLDCSLAKSHFFHAGHPCDARTFCLCRNLLPEQDCQHARWEIHWLFAVLFLARVGLYNQGSLPPSPVQTVLCAITIPLFIYTYNVTCLSCQEARCVCRQAAVEGCQISTPCRTRQIHARLYRL